MPPSVGEGIRISAQAVIDAIGSLAPHQALNKETGAVHAAGFWRPSDGLVCLREDVGRHNALDKLIGALLRSGEDGRDGVLLLTSRVSVEMVQKAAVLGTSILVAVSAPTALAIRTATAAGITLVAIARSDGFEVFTRPEQISRRAVSSARASRRPRYAVARSRGLARPKSMPVRSPRRRMDSRVVMNLLWKPRKT